MLADAVYIGTQPDYTGIGQGTHYFVSAMQAEGKNYRVVFQVIENADRMRQKNTPHALNENEMPAAPDEYTPESMPRQATANADGLPETGRQVGAYSAQAEEPSGDASIAPTGENINIAMENLLAGYDREHIKRYDLWKGAAPFRHKK